MVIPSIVLKTAAVATNVASHPPDTIKFITTYRTSVAPLTLHFSAPQRQRMRRSLTSNTQITTRLSPLSTMGIDSTPASTLVSNKMRQLM